VQTAGQGGTISPEVSATFLKDPERAREAIRLAVKLHQQGKMQGGASGYAAPQPGTRGEVGAAVPVTAKGSGLAQRLQGLEGLVTRGVLAQQEADTLKAGPYSSCLQNSWGCTLLDCCCNGWTVALLCLMWNSQHATAQ
jgi:hypothetical protein